MKIVRQFVLLLFGYKATYMYLFTNVLYPSSDKKVRLIFNAPSLYSLQYSSKRSLSYLLQHCISISVNDMKPYNTRKPRRAKFNAFPHQVPRWGRHKKYRYHIPNLFNRKGIDNRVHYEDPWISAAYKNSNIEWPVGKRDTVFHTILQFLRMLFVVPSNVLKLFAMGIGINCFIVIMSTVQLLSFVMKPVIMTIVVLLSFVSFHYSGKLQGVWGL